MNSVLFWQGLRGSVICATDGTFLHPGIIHSVEIGTSFQVWIIDNSPSRGYVGYQTLEDFAGGKDVVIQHRVPSWLEANEVVSRAESQVGRPYDLLTYNCEHFVTQALGLEPESKQLQAGTLVVALGVVAAVMIASSAQSRNR